MLNVIDLSTKYNCKPCLYIEPCHPESKNIFNAELKGQKFQLWYIDKTGHQTNINLALNNYLLRRQGDGKNDTQVVWDKDAEDNYMSMLEEIRSEERKHGIDFIYYTTQMLYVARVAQMPGTAYYRLDQLEKLIELLDNAYKLFIKLPEYIEPLPFLYELLKIKGLEDNSSGTMVRIILITAERVLKQDMIMRFKTDRIYTHQPQYNNFPNIKVDPKYTGEKDVKQNPPIKPRITNADKNYGQIVQMRHVRRIRIKSDTKLFELSGRQSILWADKDEREAELGDIKKYIHQKEQELNDLKRNAYHSNLLKKIEEKKKEIKQINVEEEKLNTNPLHTAYNIPSPSYPISSDEENSSSSFAIHDDDWFI